MGDDLISIKALLFFWLSLVGRRDNNKDDMYAHLTRNTMVRFFPRQKNVRLGNRTWQNEPIIITICTLTAP